MKKIIRFQNEHYTIDSIFLGKNREGSCTGCTVYKKHFHVINSNVDLQKQCINCHLFYLSSICGYANCASFREINDADIDFVQNFVKNELLKRIEEKCSMLETKFSDEEKECFFGMYALSINEFKLVMGERRTITKIVKHLIELYEQKGKEQFAKHFELPPKHKFKNTNVENFSCGLFFGEKTVRSKQTKKMGTDDMKQALFLKLKHLFESFSNLKPVRPISNDIIKIINDGTGAVRAEVLCVFCAANDTEIEALTKTYSVLLEKANTWGTSNLKRHIKLQHLQSKSELNQHELKNPKLKDPDSNAAGLATKPSDHINVSLNNSIDIFSTATAAADTLSTTATDGIDIMSLPIILGDDSIIGKNVASNESLISALYGQFSSQNLQMIGTGLLHNEKVESMDLSVDGDTTEIQVIPINKNGNCLFATIMHQIHGKKNGSDEHKVLTEKLRKQVVLYIKDHLSEFTFAIKSRINYEGDKVEEACLKFLDEDLASNGFFGGMETFVAVSKIYKVNMLVFNENGPFYFVGGFNREFDRTIFLAYRTGGIDEDNKVIYNHYDSICSVSETILYKCASKFAHKMSK